jgi:hypothetical protein
LLSSDRDINESSAAPLFLDIPLDQDGSESNPFGGSEPLTQHDNRAMPGGYICENGTYHFSMVRLSIISFLYMCSMFRQHEHLF